MFTFTLEFALALCAALVPQSPLPAHLSRTSVAVPRSAGVLHVAGGTWTRRASVASLGLDTIYDNTGWTGYYFPFRGDTFVTNGRVPSPTSPTDYFSRPGCATSYLIQGFQIGYCTDQPFPGVFTVDFFNAYDCCASVIGVTPTASIPITGLPGSPSGGFACWTVTVDLRAPAQPTDLSFTLLADRDGTYQGGPYFVDSFGWSIHSSLTGTAASTTGPMVCSGSGCAFDQDFDGTHWDFVRDYEESGGGMGTCLAVRIEGGSTTPGCYWYGSCPDPNFHLELYAVAYPGAPDMTAFCEGDYDYSYLPLILPPCPCNNWSDIGSGTGCENSIGVGGRLRGTGVPSVAADSLLLTADQLPAAAMMVFCQGTDRLSAPIAFGDGLRCLGGTLIRLGVRQAGGGAAHFPDAGGPSISVQGSVLGAGLRTYQVWYRNPASYCTSATFNLTNGWEVHWTP